MKQIIPTEFEECQALVEYLDLRGLLYSHVHNEMWTSSWGQKIKAKQLGVRKGVPDYIVLTNHYCLFIEMKRKKLSKLSDEQKQWIDALNSCYGVRAMVCYGCDEAITFIEGNIPPINHNKKYQELMEK